MHRYENVGKSMQSIHKYVIVCKSTRKLPESTRNVPGKYQESHWEVLGMDCESTEKEARKKQEKKR